MTSNVRKMHEIGLLFSDFDGIEPGAYRRMFNNSWCSLVRWHRDLTGEELVSLMLDGMEVSDDA